VATANAAQPAISVGSQPNRRAAHAYTSMNAVSDSRPSSDPTAASVANSSPCSIASASRIGPTTTGSPPSQPAICGPQRRPASVVAATRPGASVSFSASRSTS
jgi:hypothetical protein